MSSMLLLLVSTACMACRSHIQKEDTVWVLKWYGGACRNAAATCNYNKNGMGQQPRVDYVLRQVEFYCIVHGHGPHTHEEVEMSN